MPGELTLTVEGAKEMMQKFETLPSKIKQQVGGKALEQGAQLLQNYIRQEKLSGQVLRVRNDRLRPSITHRIATEGDDVVARIGTNVVYARIHEYGGTITAKHAQYLTIPLKEAMTTAGVAKYRAKDLITMPSIGGFKATFFRNHVLYGKYPSGRVVPVFALKKSVTIKQRSYMRSSLKEKAQEVIALIIKTIQEILEGKQ